MNPNVTPNDSLPFIGTLRDLAGGAITAALVVLVGALVVGAVILGWGKLSKSTAAAQVGTTILLWVLFAAAVVGSASGLIVWAAGIKLF